MGAVLLLALAVSVFTRAQPSRPPRRWLAGPDRAEVALKQAAELLGQEKKGFDRDVEVLAHLRGADDALADNMQPSASVQKAYEEVGKALALAPGEFVVRQGVLVVHQALEEARRSPASADFGRLRMLLRDRALRPASAVAVRNAQRLQEETLAWLRIQELIAAHVRTLSEISGESLRASSIE